MKRNDTDRGRASRRRALAARAVDATGYPLLLRSEEVALIFGVTTETVRVWIADGKLAGLKLNGYWRVSRNDPFLAAFMPPDSAETNRGVAPCSRPEEAVAREPAAVTPNALRSSTHAEAAPTTAEEEPDTARVRRLKREAASLGYVVRPRAIRRPRGALQQQVLATIQRYLAGELVLRPNEPLTPYRLALAIREAEEAGPTPSMGAVTAAMRRLADMGAIRVQESPFAVQLPQGHPSTI